MLPLLMPGGSVSPPEYAIGPGLRFWRVTGWCAGHMDLLDPDSGERRQLTREMVLAGGWEFGDLPLRPSDVIDELQQHDEQHDHDDDGD